MNDLLRIIADNPPLLDAVRRAILAEFEEVPSLDLDNVQLGQRTRARLVGLVKVGEAFRKIENHRTVEKAAMEPNPAR